jgi:hypothetical protein
MKIIEVQRPDGTQFTIGVPDDTRIEVDNVIRIYAFSIGYHKPIAIYPITYAVTYDLVRK